MLNLNFSFYYEKYYVIKLYNIIIHKQSYIAHSINRPINILSQKLLCHFVYLN